MRVTPNHPYPQVKPIFSKTTQSTENKTRNQFLHIFISKFNFIVYLSEALNTSNFIVQLNLRIQGIQNNSLEFEGIHKISKEFKRFREVPKNQRELKYFEEFKNNNVVNLNSSVVEE